MYQEAALMYGYDFTYPDKDKPLGPELTKIFKEHSDEEGFHAPYCGYAPDYGPRAFGVECAYWSESETDEDEDRDCWDFGENGADYHLVGLTEKDEIEKMEAEAKKEFAELWAGTREEVKEELKALGEPYFFTLWSTS